MRVHSFDSLDALLPEYQAVFEEAGRASFYSSLAWWRCVCETATDEDDVIRIYGLVSDDGRPKGVLVGRFRAPGRFLEARTLRSLSNMYTMVFEPVLAADTDVEAAANAFVATMRSERPTWDAVHLDALDRDAPAFEAFATAFRAQGFVVHPYFHFGNWYEPTAGDSHEAYFKRRPSRLRNTVKRKRKKLESTTELKITLVDGRDGLEEAMAAYDEVYQRSWKEPEPYPRFTGTLAKAAADCGALRMGVLFVDGAPVAAQIWLLGGGRATIYKLAYDEAFKEYSVGSILTDRIARHVLDVDRVAEIDFGRGDDPYKKDWLAERRERWGMIACNTRSPLGLLSALRHVAPARIKRALGR
jgi:CelD/BcsL family acetyltransferase involved in cellulose biosynthesis